MGLRILIAVIGYTLGCLLFSYILGKIVRKIDIREHGTTNAGASNATIVMGWKYGILAGLGDVLKGLIAVLIVKALYPDSPELAILAGVAAIIGHIFPLPLKFRGGKGVATMAGMLLGFNPAWGLLAILIVLILTVITDYIVYGSIAVYILLPIIALVEALPLAYIILTVLLMLLGIYKHLSNLRKIANKEEIGLRQTLKRKTAA